MIVKAKSHIVQQALSLTSFELQAKFKIVWRYVQGQALTSLVRSTDELEQSEQIVWHWSKLICLFLSHTVNYYQIKLAKYFHLIKFIPNHKRRSSVNFRRA